MNRENRQTGRTTAQMLDAPKDSIYVWPTEHLHYATDLARHLSRSDLKIVSASWLNEEYRYALSHPVVIDHVTWWPELTSNRQRNIACEILEWQAFHNAKQNQKP